MSDDKRILRAAVEEATETLREAQLKLDSTVREARANGCSWADIGAAAGMTRQSAWERWARSEN